MLFDTIGSLSFQVRYLPVQDQDGITCSLLGQYPVPQILILALLFTYSIANRIFGSIRGKRDKRAQDKIFTTAKKSLSGTEAVLMIISILTAFGIVLFILLFVFIGDMPAADGFKKVVLTTSLPNKEWQNGITYSMSDYVFIPTKNFGAYYN